MEESNFEEVGSYSLWIWAADFHLQANLPEKMILIFI